MVSLDSKLRSTSLERQSYERMTSPIKATMVENRFENMSSGNPQPVTDVSRRELLKRGGKVAAAAAVSSVFSPFVFTGKAAATKTLSFWQFYAPSRQVLTNQSKWFEDCVKGWNTTHDVKVNLEFVPVQDYIGGAKVQTAFASGQGPDIFIISPGDFLRYYNGGVLVDLTSYMEDAAKKDFFRNVMETRIVDEKIYGVPIDVVPLAMFYSLKAFAEAGLSESDIPKTWDQFLEIAHKLTKGDRFGCLFQTAPGVYQNLTWYPFMWQGGGDITTPDGKHSAFASPATVQALKFWQDAIQQNVAPRTALGSNDGGDVVANLASGFCAMQNAGVWGVSNLRDNAKDFQYGVFPLPLPPSGQQRTILGGWAFVANANGKNPEEAAKFCVWAVGSMQDDSVQRVVDWCTKANSMVPPRKSALEKATTEGGFSSAPMKLFKDLTLLSGRSEPRVPPDVYKAVSDTIQACQLIGADPKRAAEEGSQQIETFLSGYAGAPLL
jgi:multiple sugar transport system substrate-binding protein